ncbi:hypothetical protein [Thermogemmatispora carboxidivorans]|uniref:hypothetical protein n=1 Tax=Thermogemmatispora carboxidivorans TaxID=1382306 RepID=UPI00069B8899|nr:hypothetical protein [Thermogemmatispora carboxidivorans]
MTDALTSLVLRIWQNHNPALLMELQRENRLETALEAEVERLNDLLYELEVIQKMSHQAAWEIAVDQILLPGPEEESSSTTLNQNREPPAISE